MNNNFENKQNIIIILITKKTYVIRHLGMMNEQNEIKINFFIIVKLIIQFSCRYLWVA